MELKFLVDPKSLPSTKHRNLFVLRRSDWDDYGYGTTFTLYAVAGDEENVLGNIKVAEMGQESNGAYSQTKPTQLESAFRQLPPNQFSVAQDASYYYNLIEMFGEDAALRVARALNDLASMDSIPDDIVAERVTQRSLLRYVSLRTVMDQYREILHGKTSPQPFSLTYYLDSAADDRKEVKFVVDPKSVLPSNLHVIIGPNGMGKTTTLRRIAAALDEGDPDHDPDAVGIADPRKFAGLVSVSFSAFDIFPKRNRLARSQAEFRVTRVGLPIRLDDEDEVEGLDLLPEAQGDPDPAESQRRYWRRLVKGCLTDRPERLQDALTLLAEADQVLDSRGITDPEQLLEMDFAGLSSGHKIVLLTMCSLVRYCEARTLVLIDEPESHLHPPLLGAFARALSDLMTETNGLAIVATHSPVVLQEVPKDCAWKFWSLEGFSTARRPDVQTFGENLGVLTEEVFGLELDKSGFHALLRKISESFDEYPAAKRHLGGSLGDEAKVLLRSMIETKISE